MGEWSGLSGQKGLYHGEFRHPFLMEQGSDQSGESLAWFRLIEPGGMIHPGFGNTSGPSFPIQANRQIQMMRIEIHHQFNRWFRQKGKDSIRSMVSAGNRRYCRISRAGRFDRLPRDFHFLSEFGKQLSMKGSGKLIQIGNTCGKYPAWHEQPGIMPVAWKIQSWIKFAKYFPLFPDYANCYPVNDNTTIQ